MCNENGETGEIMVVECPHCEQKIEVLKLNCRIFRCGVLKKNFKQINPHAPKNECDHLVRTNQIYGCGRPFRIDETGKAVICDYI